MGKIISFIIAGGSSLFIFGYAVHMFIGDLVPRSTEIIIIAAAVTLAAVAMAWMTWDVMRRR